MATKKVALTWRRGPVEGAIEVHRGVLAEARIVEGKGEVRAAAFSVSSTGPPRLELTIDGARVEKGADQTMVTVRAEENPFTFFLRDVSAEFPIHIPKYGVAVTASEDGRGYPEIAAAVRSRGLASELKSIEARPEETYEDACRRNRDQNCPTWLGLSRDMRIFRVGYRPEHGYWGFVEPCYHSVRQSLPETGKPYAIEFCIGPGASCRVDVTRRLEEGALPVLRSVQREGDVTYNLTIFATLETRPISLDGLRGTDWRAAYRNMGGQMLTPEDIEGMKDLLEAETRGREEEVVCCIRVEAVNSGEVPRYAWLKGLFMSPSPPSAGFEGERGFSVLEGTRVYGVNRLDGRPMPEEEMAILLQPGERTVLEMLVPHRPLPRDRAENLRRLDVDEHLAACREFWRAKLASAARVSVPEPAIDERVRAGLLHCDINALGLEPDGNVAAAVGWYSPIGSESAPIIQFFDSVGWHRLAERSLDFFLDRQREDGFIQNFGGYELETGPLLWTMGEHYRYTRDDEWVKRVRGKLLKACDYLLKWRERNKTEELRGRGYGLLDGKVADPEDYFHSFMLNGLSYLGIQRAAEMLEKTAPAESRRLAKEAEELRKDIRAAFCGSLARSPVIPTGDGTWAPSVPPWAEHPGPVALYADGGKWFTHGAFGARDSLIGALYLVISEVLDPDEIGTTFLLKSHQELFTVENAGLSQPYYCRHDYIHLRRGEVKAFLKTYYNQLAALQDRETYTFWEHYFHASSHKTHEEGWFLMQTRWMLWLEEGDTLAFLCGVPRRWMEDGKRITLEKVATYFGPASLSVESRLAEGVIEATVECGTDRRPKEVVIRLPHPAGERAVSADGASYEPASEVVRIAPFEGAAKVVLRF